MMRVQITEAGPGLHPAERVVSVATRDGEVKLAVDSEALQGTTLGIGFPIREEGGFYLIELPRETFQGAWRVWVSTNQVTRDEARSRVYA